MAKHYMYVLACADQTLYTGYTTDLKRREKAHQSGKGAKYTRPASRRPCYMIYAKAYANKSAAMSAEYAFKHQKRPAKEAYLTQQGIDFSQPLTQQFIFDNTP
ncbi:GIY-YIG nuclease family protein [Aerococcus sanguinicola]|uniref:GIY-YIG nuclease family protein n=1 Tax=unclassified Aerococcus TaxID=2618060 RepID=UPI0008A1E0F4|nr:MULTISPECIES: GIY-YIG nuclease family protein [unclassified Aerococcus]KAB0646274.1 GIY-YIG nuclease family protein [Aerococcus sanguinicola]MDK6233107.1 GIY-YIG nuclease family protein [Aerococcus sp. UMB10185]MDK6855687.1 GIY-YIG nuclease family protein [Aerococcus sp. UMB7533]MDK8502464.1 GIY-YIG nuclease family protein [Aerococcus sp. UMB1112A]OFN00166.1 hypothetical protein HMPREF2626_09850 [Aerococcus sp. HMSC062A02]